MATTESTMKMFSIALLLVFHSCTFAEERNPDANLDPWKKINQVTHRFNDTADRYVFEADCEGLR